MRNAYFMAVALCSGTLASSAYAQNSVTLYGVIDTGLMYVHNSGGESTQWMMASGTESGSRWGLKGSEDLGGGLKTIFQIENGFNSTTGRLGQGGRMFGRQAWLGLANGDSWGSVTLGRQYDPLIDLVQPVQGDNYLGGFFSSPGDIDNADNSVRINNAVKWSSPNWSGVQASAMYSFGGVAGATGSGQTYSGAVAYNGAALSLAAGFLHIDNGNGALGQRTNTSADSLFNSSVNAAYASARSANIARVGSRYTVQSITLGGYYSYSLYSPDALSTFNHSEKYHNGSVYAVWQVSPALLTEIGYDYLRALGDSSATYQQVSIGGDYNLSKRTDVYAVASYGHASGENGAGPAQAVIGSTDIDAGKHYQVIATVGLRHRF